MPAHSASGPDTTPTGPDQLRRTSHPLPVTFSGSGSEYFRIWIVNLLLTLVTLGLYYPWAKVRRLRYFHGNTWVGEHALAFHGNPRRMLRGFLLVALMLVLYSVAGHFSPAAGLVSLLIIAAVWPALFRAAQQFRLANTSWRGLRFHFTGGLGGAYRCMLPLFAPGLLVLGLVLLAPGPDDAAAQQARDIALLVITLAVLLLTPYLWWLLKKYQHGHYALGRVQTSLRSDAAAFYGVYLKTAGVALLAVALAGALVGVLAGVGLLASALPQRGASAGAVLMLTLAVLAMYAALLASSGAFFASRMQNLLWSRTKSTQVRFDSTLRFRSLAGMTLLNWLLVLLTLGLYWPFAAVAVARLKLQAVTVHTRMPPDELIARERPRTHDAAGDAAVDLLGFDIGL
jgi:uncharacterized membrane protein YjgN (DUF898 family)